MENNTLSTVISEIEQILCELSDTPLVTFYLPDTQQHVGNSINSSMSVLEEYLEDPNLSKLLKQEIYYQIERLSQYKYKQIKYIEYSQLMASVYDTLSSIMNQLNDVRIILN